MTFNTSVYNISTCNECSANIKDLDGLIPGTEYTITLAACTNGGCTNSSELRVKTLESLPIAEDIQIYSNQTTSTSILVEWTRPKRPNGRLVKYLLYKNEIQVYEGNRTFFNLLNLTANSFFKFRVDFCNSMGCSSSRSISLNTDESEPEGAIILEAQAKGSNQIQLKWYADPDKPLKQNGNLLFSVFVNGPFLLDFNTKEAVLILKNNSEFTKIQNLNLLNTTIYNTKYGILDRILPYSVYSIQVNASNSKGFLLSNRVQVETVKSNPDIIIPPQLVYSQSRSLKIEWFEPILINSEDRVIFYQLTYRIKYIWNSNGTILTPFYQKETITLFSTKSLATFYVLTNLTPYTAYSFQLTASNSYGEAKSEWSEDYYTKEELPRIQPAPRVLNFTSTSVLLEWSPAQVPNGLITSYRINILRYQNDSTESNLFFAGITTVSNQTNQFNITHLIPFSFYLFTIESCNSVGCVQSEYDKFNLTNNSYIQTEPSAPEKLLDPILNSPNSYSIEIKWNLPNRPNGKMAYFILERVDYSLPLSNRNENLVETTTTPIRRYRFEANKFKFLDDSDLESCGVYSYRIIAFNQVGSVSSKYVNVSVRASKPLIVTPPVINLIDSFSARFEWLTPLTYCQIKSYTLTINQVIRVFF